MSGKLVPTYRLPTARATQIGSVRIVKDRNGTCYADGSKVISTNATGVHTVLVLADSRAFYVLTVDLQRVPQSKK